MHIYIHSHSHTYMHACIRTYKQIHTYNTYTHTNMHTYVRDTFSHTNKYIHAHTHTNIHTYIHKHTEMCAYGMRAHVPRAHRWNGYITNLEYSVIVVHKLQFDSVNCRLMTASFRTLRTKC
jgi:hypothetical protein